MSSGIRQRPFDQFEVDRGKAIKFYTHEGFADEHVPILFLLSFRPGRSFSANCYIAAIKVMVLGIYDRCGAEAR